MSRESDEVGNKQHDEQFGVQPGNPDHVGYPGEAPLVPVDISAEINQLLSII